MNKFIIPILLSFILSSCTSVIVQEENKESIEQKEKPSLESLIGDYGDYSITRTSRGIAIRSYASTTFKVSNADLLPGSELFLNDIAFILNNTFLSNRNVLITGHTDSSGSRALNDKLSLQRAQAVMNALNKRGVDASRMMAEGFSSDEPIADNHTKEGKAMNRRVDIIILEEKPKQKCQCVDIS